MTCKSNAQKFLRALPGDEAAVKLQIEANISGKADPLKVHF